MKAAETNVLKLLQGSKVFLVPNFQRRYSWRRAEWEQLWEDLIRECRQEHGQGSQSLEGHFLGSVVLHPAPGGASVLMKHLVVDGQQRLTTLLILIAAMRDVGEELDVLGWNRNEYEHKYLVNQYDEEYPDRLVPTKLDRDAYTNTIRKRIPTEGVGQAYTFFVRKLREILTHADDDMRLELPSIAQTLLLHMLVVEITTTPGDSVNNIFNRLNSKGMELSPADLVRNELLLELNEVQSDEAYERYWVPMERNLVKVKANGDRDDRLFVTFLWAREVAYAPDTTRLNLFLTFERRFRSALTNAPTAKRSQHALRVFEDIHDDHQIFLMTLDPLNSRFDGLGLGDNFRTALDRIRRWRSDPCIPLMLWIAKQVRQESISEAEAVEVADLILGYLVRRALAGIPTNQLNRLITPIAHQLQTRQDMPLVERLRQILVQKGYHWPTDADVLGAIIRTPLYLSARRNVPFILNELESLYSPKERVDTSNLTIEHVMPQSMPSAWVEPIQAAGEGIDEALALVHTLGNLTLTGYNSELSNSSFERKRRELRNSKLALNDEIAKHDTFLPRDIEARSRHLAEILLPRLSGPPRADRPESFAEEERAERFAQLEGVLQSIPEGSWTSEEDLIPLLGVESSYLRLLVNELGAEIARLVRDPDGSLPSWLAPTLRASVEQQASPVRPDRRLSSTELAQLVETVELASTGDAPEATERPGVDDAEMS